MDWREAGVLRRVLLRALNGNQALILLRASKSLNRSLTSLLRDISADHGVPLSTLKLNAKILRELGLLDYDRGQRPVRLTSAGRKVVEILSHEGDPLTGHVYSLASRLGPGHLHSSLTCLQILKAVFSIKRDSDVVVLSKGHAAPALYSILLERGCVSEEDLRGAGEPDSRLQAHPEAGLPEVLVSTGSLGQGLSIANGVAIAARIDGLDRRVFVVLGDGELDEGQVWEAAATASAHGLSSVVAVVDRNGTQLSGSTEEVKPKEPLRARWAAFGWEVVETSGPVRSALEEAVRRAESSGRPAVVIVHTGGESGAGAS